MPRRVSNEQALAEVMEVWPEGQNEVTAADLRASLVSAGKNDLIPYLRSLKDNRQLYGYVRLNEDGSTTHIISKTAPA